MLDHNLALRPNCLLTRKPLVFISGLRSLFYYTAFAAPARQYLEAHGYRVYSPPLPFRGPLRSEALKNFLKMQPDRSFHFFLSPETKQEMQDVRALYPESSVTLSSDFKTLSTASTPLRYRLHRLFLSFLGHRAEPWELTLNGAELALLDRILDRCIELAENDHICET